MNRRYFIPLAASAVAQSRAVAANDKVTVAFIGVRGQGRSLAGRFSALADVNVAYVCDVDPAVVEPALKSIEKNKGSRPPVISDLRRILDDKSVDAVVIATPDHWHAPATILACDAGKDVYVEKPLAHNIREGRLMIEAARRNKRIVQHGTQLRSRPAVQRAIEYAHSGKIGRVLMAKAWNVQLRDNIGRKQDSAPPAGIDYDTWIGPAPALPFNPNRFHYNWHWNWNYGTGDAGNDGVHQLDQARWALGVGAPLEVSGSARKLFFDDDQQTPDTMTITFNYADKALLFEMRIWNNYGLESNDNAVSVYGTNGYLQIGRWDGDFSFRVFDNNNKLVHADKGDEPDTHPRNFIDCLRSRKSPNADIETAHLSSLHSHLANIVARTGRTLRFDPQTETILNDPDSSALTRRSYRSHWATPKGV